MTEEQIESFYTLEAWCYTHKKFETCKEGDWCICKGCLHIFRTEQEFEKAWEDKRGRTGIQQDASDGARADEPVGDGDCPYCDVEWGTSQVSD